MTLQQQIKKILDNAPEWTKLPLIVSKKDFKMIMKHAKKANGFDYLNDFVEKN